MERQKYEMTSDTEQNRNTQRHFEEDKTGSQNERQQNTTKCIDVVARKMEKEAWMT